MALLNQDLYPTSTNDGISYFYGVKIKGEWYFFKGPFIVLFRENYQDDVRTPLSFAKLHEIAVREVFGGYLRRQDRGLWAGLFGRPRYEVNEAFFNQLDYSNWGFFDKDNNVVDNSKLSQAQLDSHLLAKAVYDKWNYRDTTNYKPLK